MGTDRDSEGRQKGAKEPRCSPDLLVIETKALRKSVRESTHSLGGSHGSSLEQIELGPAVHLPLQQLQPVDLPFHLPVAPALTERRPYGCVVPA